MQVTSYKNFIQPKSEYVVIISQEQQQPYIRQYDYFKNISKPNLIRYCQNFDIDLVIIDDFKRNQYISTQSSNFNNRSTNYPFVASKEIIKNYKYSLLWNSNVLVHKNYPHFKEKIISGYDCISLDGPKPQNRNIGHQNWFGHTMILNSNMIDHFFDQNQLLKYNTNDLIYRNQYHKINSHKYKSLTLHDKYLLCINYWCLLAINNGYHSAESIFKFISDNVDFSEIINDNQFVCTFFGGCGSYSPLWKLRYMLMELFITKYKEFYF